MSFTRFNFPTPIVYGAGSRSCIATELKQIGASSALLVTDEGVAKLPILDLLSKPLLEAGFRVEVFSGISGNPKEAQVIAGVQAFRDANADCILAFGGGAAIDVAKVIALMVNHPGALFDYEDGNPNMPAVDQAIPFVVGIPTTAGTGSEVGRSSVISDDSSNVKRIVFHPRLLPPLVVLDPDFTLGLPATITAATGIDALSHSLEAILVNSEHPICDGIALEGMRLISENLLRCHEFAVQGEGTSEAHLQARGSMLLASTMGAIAFQKGLGLAHSCAHALGAVNNLHHGLAIAIVLPHVMAFNKQGSESKFARISRAIGIDSNLVDWLRELSITLKIPASLTMVGVQAKELDTLASMAYKDPLTALNPRTASLEDVRGVLAAALA